MVSYSCPSCGAKVPFLSRVTVFAVCNFCKSTVVRHDEELEVIGKQAILPDDLTPLQIGTNGAYGISFIIVGRVRLSWNDGFWNEWYLLFDDGTRGWLAEAQGTYAICFEKELNQEILTELLIESDTLENKDLDEEEQISFKDWNSLLDKPVNSKVANDFEAGNLSKNKINLDKNVVIDSINFRVADRKKAHYVSFEGELPFKPISDGRMIYYVDLISINGDFASLEYRSENDQTVSQFKFFSGNYVDFDALKLDNLRILEDWEL